MSRQSEIAQKAGTSVGTVSHVLGGKGTERRISVSTQRKVLEAALELKYIDERKMRQLLDPEKPVNAPDVPVFSFVFRASTPVTVLGELLNGIQRSQTSTKYSFITNMVSYSGQGNNDLLSVIDGLRTNGIIIIGSTEKEKEELEDREIGIPVVFINRPSEKYNSVVIDNATAKANVLKLLHTQGCKNACFITTKGFITDYSMTLEEGKTLLLKTCAGYGINADICVRDREEAADYGYNATRRALRRIPRPDVIFYSSDIAAFGGLRALLDEKISVPGDIELITCGTDYILNRMIPYFDQIRYAIDEMVEYSLNILINSYYNADFGRKSILLAPVLRFRDRREDDAE